MTKISYRNTNDDTFLDAIKTMFLIDRYSLLL